MNVLYTGRGALSNRASRYDATQRVQDPPTADDEPPRDPATRVIADPARSVISRNESPDVPFRQSINPYRGCEHGCIYCFARPSHAWLGHSPGLDFETLIYAKHAAPERLAEELAKPGYTVDVIHLGANTDPYQPAERELGITRRLLETLLACGHPVTVLTKSALVLRDLDLLRELARRNLTRVYLSVTTLEPELKRTLEPRAASGAARLRAVAALAAAGVPTGIMVAPIIPAVNDHELEEILERAAGAGARHAGWILLRLPLEVSELVQEWLATHRPLAARRVMALLREARGGRDNDPRFGARMRGRSAYAALIGRRFEVAARRLGFVLEHDALDLTQFRAPGPQLSLW
jgi:DNA repair photolyase